MSIEQFESKLNKSIFLSILKIVRYLIVNESEKILFGTQKDELIKYNGRGYAEFRKNCVAIFFINSVYP